MKKTFNIQTIGTKSQLKLKLDIDLDRELNDVDNILIRKHIESLIEELRANSISLDPNSKLEAENIKNEILKLFTQPIHVKEIPNGYWGNAYWARHLPWFEITTYKGIITIGWRKRVINIDWSKSDIKIESKELFPDENVTKFDQTIHAHNLSKAKEYIDKILNQ